MKRTLVSLILLVLATGMAVAQNYTTNFPLTENPISEGGKWLNGSSAAHWHDCRSTGNVYAFGTEPGQTNYDDSTCILTSFNGAWGLDQTVQAVIKVNNAPTAQFEEAELRLRTNIDSVAKTITGYEVNCSVDPSDPYIEIVRWNGGFGKFTQLDGRSVHYCKTGDVLKATAIGNTISVYWNNTLQFSVTDTKYNATNYCNTHPCNPGMGFYIQNGNQASNADFGFSSFTAVASGGGVPTAPNVTPASVTLASGSQQQFTADQSGVAWAATMGTITSGGLFTAPTVTTTQTVTVTATNANGTGQAVVTVNPAGCQ